MDEMSSSLKVNGFAFPSNRGRRVKGSFVTTLKFFGSFWLLHRIYWLILLFPFLPPNVGSFFYGRRTLSSRDKQKMRPQRDVRSGSARPMEQLHSRTVGQLLRRANCFALLIASLYLPSLQMLTALKQGNGKPRFTCEVESVLTGGSIILHAGRAAG